MNPIEPFDEEQSVYAKGNTFKEHQDKLQELAFVLDCKLDKEESEQTQLITLLKQEYEKEERNQEKAIMLLDRWASRKLVKPYSQGFKVIAKERKVNSKSLINNVVKSLAHIIEFKAK